MVDYKGFRVPEWKNKGTEPIEEFRQTGWKISQKPPAEYFNWFFSSTYDSIKKLIDDQDTHSKLTNNPHKVTSEQVNTYNKQTIDDKVKKVNDDLSQSITNHANKTDNPHKVTAEQVNTYNKNQIETKINRTKETITQETDAKVSNLDSKLTKTINEHASRTDNPHKVTAAQTGSYTKEQTDEAIKNHIPEIPDIDLSNYDTKPEVDKKIETAIDDIEIGGRNLLHSGNISNFYHMGGQGMIGTVVQNDLWHSYVLPVVHKEKYFFKRYDTPTASGGDRLRILFFEENPKSGSKGIEITETIEDDMTEKCFSVPENVNYMMILLAVGSKAIPFKNVSFKLERGNKATDWTPAPEDVDAKIDSVKDYVSSEIEKQSSEWFGTLEEYEALETKDDKTIYYIHD